MPEAMPPGASHGNCGHARRRVDSIATMEPLDIAQAQERLPEIVQWVASTWEKVPIMDPSHAVVLVVPSGLWYTYEDTLNLLADPEAMRRIQAGDDAIQNGDFVTQREIAAIAPAATATHGQGSPTGKAALVPGTPDHSQSTNTSHERWHLVLSGPVMREIRTVPEPSRSHVLSIMLGALLDDPRRAGIELRATLARRLALRVAGYRVIYRMDTVKHAVRVIDVAPVSSPA